MTTVTASRVWPGRPHPLGATWDGQGVNFAVFSEHAKGIELCLFDEHGLQVEKLGMVDRTGSIFHAYLPDARPGLLYGFRAHGPYAPHDGHRFNPSKLLIDPYAKAFTGRVQWDDAVYGYRIGDGEADLSLDDRDSAPHVPKSRVIETAFSWGDDKLLRTPWSRTVIYEAHVKGLSMRHPDVPEAVRGTYLGVASEPIIDHMLRLGITAIELLPIQTFESEPPLAARGLTNYWGYNTFGFFAPDARFASGDRGEQVSEFKTMVKKLHAAGIEVLLDVVYNHTTEGDHLGPTLSFRGLDNVNYYHLVGNDRRHYMDFTGCGNSVNVSRPPTMRLVMDSLRYWVDEMHVDGFRFDLAPVLGRSDNPTERFGLFFDVVKQDPVLAEVKLIAEPWDLGPDGFQLGRFPAGWAEWNSRFRDSVRRFWRGDPGQVAELASRLSGSSDLFSQGPGGSLNFIVSHDGYTLRDLVTYEAKHNEANGEDNADGHGDNASRNWGHEGETDNEQIITIRERMQRNLMGTLVLSQGVAMLCAGDELGRTQHGNNNAYCQDSETSWIDWNLSTRQRDMLAFTRRLLEVHRDNPVLRRSAFFSGRPLSEGKPKDVTWVRRDGLEMTQHDWTRSQLHVLGMLVHGEAGDEKDERGIPLRGDTLLMLLNGGERIVRFRLPHVEGEGGWTELLNTIEVGLTDRPIKSHRRSSLLPPHTLVLLKHVSKPW